jgi:hypothetical protein
MPARAIRQGSLIHSARASSPETVPENDESRPKAALVEDVRQRPTLPPSCPGSTIGAGGLNFRVRDGTGCLPSAMATETLCRIEASAADPRRVRVRAPERTPELESEREQESSPRPISTGQLNTLPCFHFRPINLVVYEGPYLVSQREISSWGELRT